MRGCQHPVRRQKPGGLISLRYGTAQTRVCTDCGAWRLVDHHGNPDLRLPEWRWRTDPLNMAMIEKEEE